MRSYTHFLFSSITFACVFFFATGIFAQDVEQPSPKPANTSWVVYYGSALPSKDFDKYDIIVFDREKHPPIQNLKAKGKMLLGYISVGEAEKYRPDYETIKATHALLEENKNWKGHFSVDVRRPEWTQYLIQDVIPQVIRGGFDGIFIDTLDSAEDLEAQNPKKYAGMVNAAGDMIRTIRLHYPDLRIMINRGFAVMPLIANDVDYLLAEGVMANYDFKKNKATLFPDAVYQEYVDKMLALKRTAPQLRLMTLDYWDMKDTEGVKAIYARQKANGFMPYVTTIGLDRVDAEPK